MRVRGMSVVLLVGASLVGCSAPVTGTRTLFTFEGSVDVANGVLEIHRPETAGRLQSALTLPYGTGVSQVYFHTLPGTAAWDGIGNRLSADVQAVNGFPSAVANLTAIIDSVSAT